MSRAASLISAVALLAIGLGANTQARDIEMGGDGPTVYAGTAPVPNATTHHRVATRARHAKAPRAAKPR